MPSKSFDTMSIPSQVRDSLTEAERSLQANANIAACVMLGRALEALCHDVLQSSGNLASSATKIAGPKKHLMLGQGIRELRKRNIIDDRLFNWSQQLQAFRNMAAHPGDVSISRQDAVDLQTFVHAIVEYVYDLSKRYDEFKARTEKRASNKKK